MAENNTISNTRWLGFEKQLRTYVRSRVQPQYVDDVVGDILLRLVQNETALQSADNPSAYVQRVGSNMVTDFYRRKAVERRTLTEIEFEKEIAANDKSGSGDDAQFAIARCMHPFIKDLPRPYSEALTLTEIEQLTQKQAAERLGLSLSGLKSRVQRGRALLKRSITQCCSIELDRRGHVMDYERRASDGGKGC